MHTQSTLYKQTVMVGKSTAKISGHFLPHIFLQMPNTGSQFVKVEQTHNTQFR